MRHGSVAGVLLGVSAACGVLPACGDDATGSPGFDPPPSAARSDGGATAPARCGERAELPAGAWLGADGSLAVTCDGDAASLTISGLDDGIVRLRYGAGPGGSLVPVERPTASAPLAVGAVGDAAVACVGDLVIAATPRTCRVRAADRGGRVVLDDGATGGFYRRRETFDGVERDVLGVSRALGEGERIYGLGQHTRSTTSLDLRGSVVDLTNTDAYDDGAKGYRPDATRLYESFPIYLGLRGGVAYGVFTDNTHRMRFDVARRDPTRLEASATGGAIDQYLLAGPSFKDVLRRYTRVTGRAPLPAPWSIGLHLSRWEGPCDVTTDRPFCSAAQVVDLARRLRDLRIPADGVFLDIQHMDGYRSFTFDPKRFADPVDLTTQLAALDVHASVIVDPGIKVDPGYRVYADGLAGGHFLRSPDGAVYVGEVWPGAAAFPDFSAKKTRAWWSELAAGLGRSGVRGAWIDMNEPSNFVAGGTAPDALLVDGDGRATTMAELHNAYALFEAKATREGLAQATPGERPFVLSRAAFAGQQRYSAVWTGDAPSTWTTLAGTLPMLLQLGLSGMTFAGSDVGGYSGREESTPELYARWMALGSISPFFRVHAEKDARRQEPWSFGPDVEDATRSLAGLRYELYPYMYSAFHEASATGAPVLRPLVFEFQDDPRTHTTVDAAMLGPSLLVAPILAKGAATRKVYLPAGRWFELTSGAAYAGGAEITISSAPEPLPSDALPIFAREGSIVPRVAPSDRIGTGLRKGDLLVDVFPGPARSSFVLYEDDGAPSPRSALRTFSVEPTPTGARITATAREGSLPATGKAIVLRVRRADRGVTGAKLDGAALPSSAIAPGFTYDAADRAAVVAVPDSPAAFSVDVTYDRTPDVDGTVDVPIRVTVPPGTPATTPIHVAASSAGWTHAPLVRTGDVAEGTVRAPRGSYFFFKVTRGGWGTVEKGAACVEVTNRHALAAARARLDVRVTAWADQCP